MTPTQTLVHEHDIILQVLDSAQREVETIETTGTVHVEEIEKMVDFFKNFADRCHHLKEEKHLFVRLGQRGMPSTGGPIAVMLFEHEAGRNHIRAISAVLPQARAGNAQAIEVIGENLASFVGLLRSHIAKENNVLFPMADRILTAEDQIELATEFERLEADEIGIGIHKKYHLLADELAIR